MAIFAQYRDVTKITMYIILHNLIEKANVMLKIVFTSVCQGLRTSLRWHHGSFFNLFLPMSEKSFI